MNKFVRNFLLFMAPVFILGIAMEISLRNIPNEYLYKRMYLDQNSDQIEVLFLGSSHAYRGINPEYISRKSFNASYISQSLDYDYAIIKRYENKWSNFKYIVIPVSYFSMYYKLEEGQDAWRTKNYAIYYDINLPGRVADNSEFLSNKLAVNFERVYSYYVLHRSNITCTALGFGTRIGLSSNVDLNKTGKLAAIRQTAKPGYYFDENKFDENLDILNKIIRFAAERGIDVILYTPPGSSSYVENMDKKQLDQTISTITKLDNLFSNVIYVNFLNDKSFTETDFWDGDHLNNTGAEKLTRKINLFVNVK